MNFTFRDLHDRLKKRRSLNLSSTLYAEREGETIIRVDRKWRGNKLPFIQFSLDGKMTLPHFENGIPQAWLYSLDAIMENSNYRLIRLRLTDYWFRKDMDNRVLVPASHRDVYDTDARYLHAFNLNNF